MALAAPLVDNPDSRVRGIAREVTHPDPAERLIRSALRGEQPPWPEPPGAALAAGVLRLAQAHGACALLHACAKGAGWPAGLLAQLKEAATAQAMWELRHQQFVQQALAQLHAEGITPVLIKGTALAYSHYPDPSQRGRGDTDLLVAERDRDAAAAALSRAGWAGELAVSGEFVSYQRTLVRRTGEGVHALDLHWRINNSQVLARLFTWEELHARSAGLPALGPHARAACEVDALLIACMHRATHRHNPYHVAGEAHHDPDRLVWLADIDLLARRLTAPQWQDLLQRAQDKQLCRVCADGLRSARAALGTELPVAVLAGLAATDAEPPAVYLEGGRMRQFAMDLLALPGLRAKRRYCAELLFPPARYMRERFGGAPLPLLYLRRGAGGLVKRLRP